MESPSPLPKPTSESVLFLNLHTLGKFVSATAWPARNSALTHSMSFSQSFAIIMWVQELLSQSPLLGPTAPLITLIPRARGPQLHSRLHSPRRKKETEQTWHGRARQDISCHFIMLHLIHFCIYTLCPTPLKSVQAVVAQRSCLELTFDDAGHGQADTTETVPRFLVSDFALFFRFHASHVRIFFVVSSAWQVHVHTQLVECAPLRQKQEVNYSCWIRCMDNFA